jgi:hypothetical protein
MSWLFSRALVEAFSAVTCSDGEPYAQLNVMPIAHPFWRNDKTMEFSRLSRFGLTYRVLTESHGEALLMSYLAAFHAKTSAAPATATDSMASEADCGPRWPGLFATFDPSTYGWKTAQCSLLADSDEFSETWPRWGAMRNGESFLRPTLTPLTYASAYGSGERFPTPIKNDAEKRGNLDPIRSYGLAGHVKMWPTATATASKGSSKASLTRKNGKDRSNDRLDHAVMASDHGQLNPDWEEWLMGWPIGWTALRPLETDRFREWLQQHGNCSNENAP